MENKNVIKSKKKMLGIMQAATNMQHTLAVMYRTLNNIKMKVGPHNEDAQKSIAELELYIQKNNLNEQEAYSKIIKINNELNSKDLQDEAQASMLFNNAAIAFGELKKFTDNTLTTLTKFHKNLSAFELPPIPSKQSISASAKPSSNIKKSNTNEWLTNEIVDKVKTRLTELAVSNSEMNNVINLLVQKYEESLNLEGEAQAKAKSILKDIIHYPGWGYREDERDVYVAIDSDEVLKREALAKSAMHQENLVGTEYITDEVIDEYTNILQNMVAQEDRGEVLGQNLDIDDVGTMPVFCFDGPPGTGKTVIAKAIAKSLDMGFYDLSMAGLEESHIIYGRGQEWGKPDPGLIAKVHLKTGRERNVILLDEAEKAKGLDLQNALGQILEVNQQGYKDAYFEANIDKRKDLILLTTNDFNLLPEHIQSRVRKFYVSGYDDNTKVKILKNMAVQLLGRLHHKVQLNSTDINDTNRKFKIRTGKEIDFKGFNIVNKENGGVDAIQYIVENYITEPGVREAKDLLKKLISRARKESSNRSPVQVDVDLIHRALGKPDPLTLEIKKLNERIGKNYRALNEVRDKITDTLKIVSVPIQLDEKQALEKLVNDLREQRLVLLNDVHTIIDLLERRRDKRSINHKKEHEEAVKTITGWTEKLIEKVNLQFKKKSKNDQSLSDVDEIEPEKIKSTQEEANVVPTIPSPNEATTKKFAEMEEKIKLLQESLASQIQHQTTQPITKEQRKEFESARNELAELRRELVLELKLLKTQNAPSTIAGSGVIDPLLQSKLQHIDALQHQVTEMNTLLQRTLTAAKQTPVVSTPTMFNPNMEESNNAFLEQRLSIAEDRINDLKKLLAQRNVSHFPQMISEFPLSDNFINSSEHSPEMDKLLEINHRLDTEIQQLRENGRPADKSKMLLLQKVLDEKLNEIVQLRQDLLEKNEELLQQNDKIHQENQMYIDTTDESEIDERSNHSGYPDSDDEKPDVAPRQLRRRLPTQQQTPSRIRVPAKPPTITRHVPTPEEAAVFGARVGKMQLGYDIIKMLEKKSRKQPAVVVAAAFNKKELLNKFNEFCESVSEKIERYNDDELVGAVQQLHDIIQSKPNEAEKEKILAKKLKTEKLGPLLYRDPDKNTGNPLQRFENKTNSVAVYNGLQAKRDPGNKLTILKTVDDHPEPIVTISHEKPIDGPNFVEIICANTHPEDRDIFVTINSARKLSKDGRFTVVGCDHPPNPDAAMKLFIYGLSIGLKPRLLPATRKMIEEKRGDEHLFKIFTKHQDEGIGVVSQDVRNEIIEDLKTYDSRKKKGGPQESHKTSGTRLPKR